MHRRRKLRFWTLTVVTTFTAKFFAMFFHLLLQTMLFSHDVLQYTTYSTNRTALLAWIIFYTLDIYCQEGTNHKAGEELHVASAGTFQCMNNQLLKRAFITPEQGRYSRRNFRFCFFSKRVLSRQFYPSTFYRLRAWPWLDVTMHGVTLAPVKSDCNTWCCFISRIEVINPC